MYLVAGINDMLFFKVCSSLMLCALMGCGETDATSSDESDSDNQQTGEVETWSVTQQCEYLGGLYGCDGDFAAWDVFMESCEASIPENCSADDLDLLSQLFTCLQNVNNSQTCSDEDYSTCESEHALSGLSASCDEVIAL